MNPHAQTPITEPLLDVRGLRTYFKSANTLFSRHQRVIKAVDGVNFTVGHAETLGLVGESGCGKTTVGRTILRLTPATAGSVTFDGVDVLKTDARTQRALRKQMQIVFQDPASSLNPRMRIGDIVSEPLLVHRICTKKSDLREKAAILLKRCGMPASSADRFPHEFSGGQKQRIGIARALALKPRFIVCDEPTSALDVSVQAQILNLLKDLQQEQGISYFFISHDIAVINHMCDRIAVMYAGAIVESGPAHDIIHNPQHPYTKRLIAAAPEAATSKATA